MNTAPLGGYKSLRKSTKLRNTGLEAPEPTIVAEDTAASKPTFQPTVGAPGPEVSAIAASAIGGFPLSPNTIRLSQRRTRVHPEKDFQATSVRLEP